MLNDDQEIALLWTVEELQWQHQDFQMGGRGGGERNRFEIQIKSATIFFGAMKLRDFQPLPH